MKALCSPGTHPEEKRIAHMKKGAKIALGVAGALVIAVAAVIAWQWNNISAARYGLTLDQETIDQRLQENQQALNDAMTQYNVPEYEISREEMEQLTDGTLNEEDVARKLLEEQQPVSGEDAAADQETASSNGDAAQPEMTAEEKEIQELIATMYVLRSSYVGELEAVVQSAIQEYASGEMTPERRAEVVYSRFDELQAMEKECDGKVAAVVSRLRELLKATGQDDTLAKQVEETYREEKSLKKAAYIQEFRNG